ncbi:MAG: hypothetical protein KCHDKBKB_01028 [Elusimicrobia bacterium]|nr:hypothetical protein [Elusimicrobiota bacterium]
MKTNDPKRIKARYFSVRNEGHEIYAENVSKTLNKNILKEDALHRLRLIRQGMPSGNWTIVIEQEVRDGEFKNRASYYESFNPETGEESDS